MDNRLVIVEGLPCSGKSTTSRYISELLSESRTVHYVDEGSGDHLADWEYHAYLSEAALMDRFSDVAQEIKTCSQLICTGYVVPLCRFSGDLLNRLLCYKIYDVLPWDTEKPVMLAKWRHLAENAAVDAVYVFNCVLLQNPMCETMMRFGFPEELSLSYIREIADIIRPLKPLVIYLKNDDISSTVTTASRERDGWLDAVIDYHVNGGYGRSIAAAGFEGYISCLSERQQRELRILSMLPVETLVLDNAHRNWNAARDILRDSLCASTR